MCDSIYDVLLTLKPNLTNNIKLEEINNELKLIIPLNHPLAKEITFNLKILQNDKPNNNSNDLIQDLLNMITSLSAKVELQQKEIDSLKKRVNDLENQNKNKNQIKNEKPFNISDSVKNNNNTPNNNPNNISQPRICHFGQKEYSYIMRKKKKNYQ